MSLVECQTEEHVAVVTLSRPEAHNAISSEMADGLASLFDSMTADPEIWVVILAAVGDKAFCVGADLKERNSLDDAGWMHTRTLTRRLFDSLRALPQPTIASVFGYALGGGFELALSCDLLVAAEDARLGLPETRVGMVPGGGGTQLLARKIGPSRAKELILTGRRLTAVEAHEMGLAVRVVERNMLQSSTIELAHEIRAGSPVATREAKRAMDQGLDVPVAVGIDIEDLAWRRAVASEDRREGIASFIEKREPRWKGR